LANGTAPHGDPPATWSETSNVKWKVPIPGEGSGTPIVWGDQVFLATAIRTDRTVDVLPEIQQEPPGGYLTERPRNIYRFEVLSLDRRTGRIRWQRTATETLPHEGRHATNSYASASPTTDGQRLYVSFGSHGIYCYDLQGNLQWKRELGQMITRLGWGEGASPTLYGDSLVVNWDHEGQSFLIVLDATTGNTRWKVDRDEVSNWSTPLVVPRDGGAQVIVNATRRTTAYDLASGTILWECGGQTTNVIPSPVRFDDTAIVMSGFQGTAAYAIPLGSTGDISGTDRIAWHHPSGTPYVPSPLLVGDRLYFTSGNSAILTCLNARTGQVLAEARRLPGLKSLYASPVAAQGRIYLVGREGVALVIKDQPELEILAMNRLDDGFDASPAIVGHQLFLRGSKHLYCIAENE
jgi:outer membrane protein assembly factor BamB